MFGYGLIRLLNTWFERPCHVLHSSLSSLIFVGQLDTLDCIGTLLSSAISSTCLGYIRRVTWRFFPSSFPRCSEHFTLPEDFYTFDRLFRKAGQIEEALIAPYQSLRQSWLFKLRSPTFLSTLGISPQSLGLRRGIERYLASLPCVLLHITTFHIQDPGSYVLAPRPSLH
jgi:hypothetical protein